MMDTSNGGTATNTFPLASVAFAARREMPDGKDCSRLKTNGVERT